MSFDRESAQPATGMCADGLRGCPEANKQTSQTDDILVLCPRCIESDHSRDVTRQDYSLSPNLWRHGERLDVESQSQSQMWETPRLKVKAE